MSSEGEKEHSHIFVLILLITPQEVHPLGQTQTTQLVPLRLCFAASEQIKLNAYRNSMTVLKIQYLKIK